MSRDRPAFGAASDERRTALLGSLDHHLQDSSLDSINIADISRRAGVTRSAFYFYFENKAAAVAALMDEMYDEAFAADRPARAATAPLRERIEATIRALFDGLGAAPAPFRAMLDARVVERRGARACGTATGSRSSARRRADRERARRRQRPRRRRRRPPLATVLLELNDRALERLTLGGPLDRDDHVADRSCTSGSSAIYGRTP